MEQASVRIIASEGAWIEGEAVRQLHATAALPGMRAAIGLPDLHPGKGHPVGAALISEGIFYPHLVGNDVGCGMGLWQTDMAAARAKLDRWEKKLTGLEQPWDGDREGWLAGYGVEAGPGEFALGTIGGGNHFAELHKVEAIEDSEAFSALGLDGKRLFVLVHSGSRGAGEALLRAHADRHGGGGLEDGSEEARAYHEAHDRLLLWAEANRALIAERLLESIRAGGERVVDFCHNSVTPIPWEGQACWLHRKGAAPSDAEAVVIPGSRGTLTYLVRSTGDQRQNAYSVAHGAGRKWNRGQVKGRLDARLKPADLTRTSLGGRVICEDKTLLYEEAPQAYKDVERVVGDLVDAGLVAVIATFRPLLTYKVRR